jgi:hypothetical protein
MFSQYQIAGEGVFGFAGRSAAVLPPGYYEIQVNLQGIFLKTSSLVTDELINLPNSASATVVNEIRKFWSIADRFKKHGFAHKRGILLYGTPGTGKTASLSILSKALIAEGGIVLNGPNNPNILATVVRGIRDIEPARPIIVLLEDFESRIEDDEEGWLSVLDGQHSVDGIVYLATTNNISEIPERFTNRPSRFDRVIEVGFPNVELREAFLKARGVEEAVRWADATAGMSIAQLKELVISVKCFDNDFSTEVQRILSKPGINTEEPVNLEIFRVEPALQNSKFYTAAGARAAQRRYDK